MNNSNEEQSPWYGLRTYLLIAMVFALAGAIVIPLPRLDDLDYVTGEIENLVEYKQNRFRLEISRDTDSDLRLLVSNLNFEEIHKLRDLRTGTEIEVWYLRVWFLHGLFGLDPEAWQLRRNNELVLAYTSRYSEYLLTRRIFLLVAGISGSTSLLLTLIAGHRRRTIARANTNRSD